MQMVQKTEKQISSYKAAIPSKFCYSKYSVVSFSHSLISSIHLLLLLLNSPDIRSINSDSSGSSTASFHSLNNDLTPAASSLSEVANNSSTQLLGESVDAILSISVNKASGSSKLKTKYFDCISETSCSSSGVNSPALDPNLTKLSRGSKIGELLCTSISVQYG